MCSLRRRPGSNCTVCVVSTHNMSKSTSSICTPHRSQWLVCVIACSTKAARKRLCWWCVHWLDFCQVVRFLSFMMAIYAALWCKCVQLGGSHRSWSQIAKLSQGRSAYKNQRNCTNYRKLCNVGIGELSSTEIAQVSRLPSTCLPSDKKVMFSTMSIRWCCFSESAQWSTSLDLQVW